MNVHWENHSSSGILCSASMTFSADHVESWNGMKKELSFISRHSQPSDIMKFGEFKGNMVQHSQRCSSCIVPRCVMNEKITWRRKTLRTYAFHFCCHLTEKRDSEKQTVLSEKVACAITKVLPSLGPFCTIYSNSIKNETLTAEIVLFSSHVTSL
jgi:hypothetical protein